MLFIGLRFDGELQVDSAIIPEICQMKASDSSIAGQANVLIFPNQKFKTQKIYLNIYFKVYLNIYLNIYRIYLKYIKY